jgi:hypothetical protein
MSNRDMEKLFSLNIMVIVFIFLNTGCSSNNLLPSVKNTTESPWQNYAEARKAFDRIVPMKSTTEDLKKLGFDPFETPNVTLVTYLEILQKFMPNQSIKLEDLDDGVQNCLKARAQCSGYEVSPNKVNKKRYGSVMLDLLNFRKKTVTTGWHFKALIVLNGDLVVYKLSGGEPNIIEFEDKRNPLGPLQNIGEAIRIAPEIKP